jgi:hypothetical protein
MKYFPLFADLEKADVLVVGPAEVRLHYQPAAKREPSAGMRPWLRRS